MAIFSTKVHWKLTVCIGVQHQYYAFNSTQQKHAAQINREFGVKTIKKKKKKKLKTTIDHVNPCNSYLYDLIIIVAKVARQVMESRSNQEASTWVGGRVPFAKPNVRPMLKHRRNS